MNFLKFALIFLLLILSSQAYENDINLEVTKIRNPFLEGQVLQYKVIIKNPSPNETYEDVQIHFWVKNYKHNVTLYNIQYNFGAIEPLTQKEFTTTRIEAYQEGLYTFYARVVSDGVSLSVNGLDPSLAWSFDKEWVFSWATLALILTAMGGILYVYFSFVKGGRIYVSPPKLYLFIVRRRRIKLSFPLSFENTGASPHSINHLLLILRKKPVLKQLKILQERYIFILSKEAKSLSKLKAGDSEEVAPFIVPPHGGNIVKFLEFLSYKNKRPSEGIYQATLIAWVDGVNFDEVLCRFDINLKYNTNFVLVEELEGLHEFYFQPTKFDKMIQIIWKIVPSWAKRVALRVYRFIKNNFA